MTAEPARLSDALEKLCQAWSADQVEMTRSSDERYRAAHDAVTAVFDSLIVERGQFRDSAVMYAAMVAERNAAIDSLREAAKLMHDRFDEAVREYHDWYNHGGEHSDCPDEVCVEDRKVFYGLGQMLRAPAVTE